MKKDIKRYHISQTYRQIKPLDKRDNEYIQHVVYDTLRKCIADKLAHERVSVREEDFHTDYRLDLYVFSPSEFWGIVQEQAREMYRPLGCDQLIGDKD